MTGNTAAGAIRADVLVVEDDQALRRVVVDTVTGAGFGVTVVGDGASALRAISERPYDVVLLDLGLPVADGWHVLAVVERRRGPAVIVISARGEERDKVRALDMGADDYLAKPFGADELLARIRAVLRRVRPPSAEPGAVRWGPVTVDLGSRTVYREGEEVRLSPTEHVLLAELARHAGRTLDHRTLLRRVWGPDHAAETGYLRAFIHRLRTKLEDDPARPEVIVTVGRNGYRFGPPAPPP